MKNKFQRAKAMEQLFKKYEVLSRGLNTVQRRLNTRVLTPKEAAEKARETIGAEEEFFDLAHETWGSRETEIVPNWQINLKQKIALQQPPPC